MILILLFLLSYIHYYTAYKQEQVTRCLDIDKGIDLNLTLMLIHLQESNLENKLDSKIPQVLDQVLLLYPIFQLYSMKNLK